MHRVAKIRPSAVEVLYLIIDRAVIFCGQKSHNLQSTGSKERQIRGQFTVTIIAVQKSQIHHSDVNLKHRYRFQ